MIYIVTDEQETKTLGIKYTPTPIRNVVFDRYRFQLSGTNIPAQEKLQNDTNRLVIFDNLIPGRLYNISIWTVSGGVYSVPIDRQARLCKSLHVFKYYFKHGIVFKRLYDVILKTL